jgi:hypothetical protein
MKETDLTSQIAQLGTGLAERRRPVESDIVVSKSSVKSSEVKNLAVRLVSSDIALLNELNLWAQQSGLRVGSSTLLKAGLRLIRKDESSLKALRHVLESDGRKRGRSL